MKHEYYFRFIMLYCIKEFSGERTLSAIYHLLKGKKSSQTIQDGKLFNLSHLFSLFPKLSRQVINDVCKQLLKEGLIGKISSQNYYLTKKGEYILEDMKKTSPLPIELNGWKYGDTGRIFWRRLSLLVQVLSNIAYNNNDYLPLTKTQEDLQWVKKFLTQVPLLKIDLINLLYEDLKHALSLRSNEEASIFIQRLTSRSKIGRTFEQIAIEYNEDPVYIYLKFLNVIHSIIQLQQSDETKSAILSEIIKDKIEINELTVSTAKTRSYLLKGISVTEIASIRNLKESTIEDHIVEITLHDHTYNPDVFLSQQDFKEIYEVINKLETHQLKKVKEYLDHKYSYFQIRLAYALNGR